MESHTGHDQAECQSGTPSVPVSVGEDGQGPVAHLVLSLLYRASYVLCA